MFSYLCKRKLKYNLSLKTTIHLIKIDNRISKPTDYQQLCQRLVG